MRAAFLLFCLALSRSATASIFKPQYRPQLDNFIVQPFDYAQQYQQEFQQFERRHRSSSESKSGSSESTSGTSQSSEEKPKRNWNTPLFRHNTIALHGVRFPYDSPVYPVNVDSEHIFDEAFKTISHISEETKREIHQVFGSFQMSEEAELNATQLLQKNNYWVEEREVTTDDGYHLTLIRIKGKQGQQSEEVNTQGRPVVLLVHGLLGSADDWLLMGPGKSLAYQMADAGFDVWLGNVRGSKYSRRHSSKHPAQSDFWQFSIDEIAAHDLPAMIDYVLKVSQQQKLFYVGHSQGTTAFFAMASTQPEYRKKVTMMHAMSPMVYMSHVRSPLFRMISPKSRYYKRVLNDLGHGEFHPSKKFVSEVGGKMCQDEIECEHVCSNVNFIVSGVDTTGMDVDMLPVITKHLSASGSTRQIKHYGQAVAAEQLRKYDYGPQINEKVYGQPQPPKYNMTDVQVPVALYYSEEDWLAHPKDVERLHNELPDVRDYYKVPEKHFSHMDFQYSKKVPTVINQRVIEAIQKSFNMMSNGEQKHYNYNYYY